MSEENTFCVSCNTKMNGSYCHNCGEKIVHPNDFSILKIIAQGIDTIIHYDNKFFRSIWYLFAKPCALTNAYIQGRRKIFMKPFQLFIVINICFYFVLASRSVFFIFPRYFATNQELGINLAELAIHKAEKRGIDIECLNKIYTLKVIPNSKIYIFLFIPFLAIISYITGFRKIRELGKHLVFAIHIFSFFLGLFIIFFPFQLLFYYLFSIKIEDFLAIIPLFSIFFLYIILSLRNFYKQHFCLVLLKSLVFIIVMYFTLIYYRFGISLYTLKML